MSKTFTVHDLPESERPRERLEEFGPEALSAHELLALILGSGTSGESVMMTAQKLLSYFGSFEGIMNASLQDLKRIKGLGSAKASQIKACFEIAKRINRKDYFTNKSRKRENRQIVSTLDVYELVKSKISNYTKEHFVVLSFNNRNKVLGVDTISVGILDTNLVHPRETFEAAIRRHAANIIIAHNHPSEDTRPSEHDIDVTKRIADAGKLMKIPVLDHIIVCRNAYLSLKLTHPDLF